MIISDRYKWEATLQDERIMTDGEDLSRAAMVSLIPQHELLPRHDLVGLHFIRRFCRGFHRTKLGANLEITPLTEYVHCIVADCCRIWVRCTDGSVLITPPDYELYL